MRAPVTVTIGVVLMLFASLVSLPPVEPAMGGAGGDTRMAPHGAGESLTVDAEYVVTGTEVWKNVTVSATGTLSIPTGATLSTESVTLLAGSVLDMTGGTLEVTTANNTNVTYLGGRCKVFNVTNSSTIRMTAPDGGDEMDTSQGGDVEFNIIVEDILNLHSCKITIKAGKGTSPNRPWTSDDIDGFVSAGGNATLIMRNTKDPGNISIENSEIVCTGGEGGKAPNGRPPPSLNVKGAGGGFSRGGDVSGFVGTGGGVKCVIESTTIKVDDLELNLISGNGGSAGSSSNFAYGTQAGGGGGGYSGGDGAVGLATSGDGEPGGDISGHVGSGGDSTCVFQCDDLYVKALVFTARGGTGGDGGDGGNTNAHGASGGAGYSGGGGGSSWHLDGGPGGNISERVGGGGNCSFSLNVYRTFSLSASTLDVRGGRGGDAGDGGNANSNGGAGGGGYSGGGGGGSSGPPPGRDGGEGGSIHDYVGAGGSSILSVKTNRFEMASTTVTVDGGRGGNGGLQGSNGPVYPSGGGGGAYSAGGGAGCINSDTGYGVRGDGGFVALTVASGGDAGIIIHCDDPLIYRNNQLMSHSGVGGDGDDADAPDPTGGRGNGTDTLGGILVDHIPMSRPVLHDPVESWHVVGPTFFTWAEVADSSTNGSLVGYVFELSEDDTFSQVNYTKDLPNAGFRPSDLPSGNWYWRVKARYQYPSMEAYCCSLPRHVIVGPDTPPYPANPLNVSIMEDSGDNVVGNIGDVFADAEGDAFDVSVEGSDHITAWAEDDGTLHLEPAADFAGVERITLTAVERMLESPLTARYRPNITVVNVNDLPNITTVVGPQELVEDTPFQLDFEVEDVDAGDVHAWSVETDAGFLSINNTTGLLSGTPLNEHVGSFGVTVMVDDGALGVDLVEFTVNVSNVNDAPVIEGEDLTLLEPHEPYNVEYSAHDVDPTGDVVTWEFSSNASFLDFDEATGVLSGPDTGKPRGTYWVNLTASDDKGGSTTRLFTVTIKDINDPPVVGDVGTVEVAEDVEHTLDLSDHITDEDDADGELTLTCEGPGVVDVSGMTITLLYTTSIEDTELWFNVTDGEHIRNSSFVVHVLERNDPPVITSVGDLEEPYRVTLDEGENVWIEIVVTDEDSAGFTFGLAGDLADAEIIQNGSLLVDTRRGEVGEWPLNVTVDDGDGGVVWVEIMVEVRDVNDPPRILGITSPANGTEVEEGTNVTFGIDVDDPDLPWGDSITVTVSSNLTGTIGSVSTPGPYELTRSNLAVGTHRITFVVSDGDLEVEAWVTLTVTEEPDEPVDGGDGMSTAMLAGIAAVIIVIVTVAALAFLKRKGG